ncbi:MAG: hypothetical protein JWR60_2352 [Polaromonas sp.]|nr:hypothetical protein [Polaromonas sp.]
MQAPDFSPAADRNKQPLLEILRRVLPERGSALEIASGTGQHAAWFAGGLPGWTWQPTDAEPRALASIAAWTAQQGLGNVRPPLLLDVMAPRWLAGDGASGAAPVFDAIFCANMLHISPWETCAALMRGSARHLAPGGVLITYGPYLEDGVPTSAGNLAFDQGLRQQNPAWGIRHRQDVEQQAALAGLRLTRRYAMPANNLLLIWRPAA